MVTSFYHTEEKQLYLDFKPRALTSMGIKQVILYHIKHMNKHDTKTWIDWMSSNLNGNIAIVTKLLWL